MSLSALWALSLAAVMPGSTPAPAIRNPAWLSTAHHVGSDRAKVSVWMDRQDPYHRGDEAQIYIKAEQDAYVTVLRIDTDGRVRVLFPIDPQDDNFARGGQAFEVLGRSQDAAFRVDDAPGQGFIFAIASTDPFTYDGYTTSDHWDYRTIADGRVRGDPYVTVTDLAAQIAPEGSWDYDMIGYDVEQHYDYPRFVCYDCHQYTSFYSWNPYDHFCSQYSVVIYDDPFYYPYRYYGTGAVYGRPVRPGPRYVFKNNDGSGAGSVRHVQFRPRGPDGRYNQDRGRTGSDLGGRGSVPIPQSGGGRRSDPLAGARGGTPTGRPTWNGGGSSGTPGTGRPAEPGRRNVEQPGQPPRTGDGNRPNESQPGRRNDPGNQPEIRGHPEPPRDRPTPIQRPPEPHDPTPVQRPPERPDPPPQRGNDRPPPPAVQPRPSPPPAAQPRSSPPPSRPTGEPELRRRKP